MSDVLKEAQDVAKQCETLLNNPIFGKTVDLLEQQLFDEWKSATTVEERESKHSEYLGLKSIVTKLAQGMHEAEILAEQLRMEDEDQSY